MDSNATVPVEKMMESANAASKSEEVHKNEPVPSISTNNNTKEEIKPAPTDDVRMKLRNATPSETATKFHVWYAPKDVAPPIEGLEFFLALENTSNKPPLFFSVGDVVEAKIKRKVSTEGLFVIILLLRSDKRYYKAVAIPAEQDIFHVVKLDASQIIACNGVRANEEQIKRGAMMEATWRRDEQVFHI